MGDGLMALFTLDGSDARRCCRSAIRAGLQAASRMADLNRHAERHFGRRFHLRIGLHYGPLIVGNVGHRSKRQLTAMGDTVNVASRIEAQAKELGTAFLASWEAVAPVRKEVIHGTPFRARLRGQTRSHSLVEIIGLRGADPAFVVQSTFARVMPEADLFARIFYEHLFRLDPSLCPMFATTDFVEQRRMLLNMIGVTVQGLDCFAEVVPILRDLGERHVEYGVRPEHYDTAGRAFSWLWKVASAGTSPRTSAMRGRRSSAGCGMPCSGTISRRERRLDPEVAITASRSRLSRAQSRRM